jgi:hypothetical protein
MTQACWDGSIIPTTSVCPAQYKVCSNGTTVFVGQSCPIISVPTPVIVPPVVKFNNVVTSVATEITNKSGRCRGIGLIANNVSSTAWFEYGETAGLGRTTAQANIGSAPTAPFSNLLTNLKPTTTYFCRAVMQNQYGIVKGEIVSFKTKATATTYVKPVTHVVKKPTAKPVKNNNIICSDGSTISVGNQSSATLINSGKKLVTLDIEKVTGTLASNSTVTYTAKYKNLSDTRLSDVLMQITIPNEIEFASSSVGSYDKATHIFTVNQSTVDPYEEGVVTFTGKVINGAQVGKTIVVTAYIAYTVPGTSVTDEVTAYVVGTILQQKDAIVDTTKHDVATAVAHERGFLPQSLVEWLALIAILFIIFILGRSIYSAYHQKEEPNGH